MLKIIVPGGELFDPKTGTFEYTKPVALTLEHSLLSLSKWESEWKKPFIDREHSIDEFNDYIRCMTLTKNVDPNVYEALTDGIRKEVQKYIDDPKTAAVVHDDGTARKSTKFVTSDLIYYWMVEAGIPFDPCEKWHLNRLLMLIRIIGVERRTDNKMSKADSARHHAATNAARRAKMAKRRR